MKKAKHVYLWELLLIGWTIGSVGVLAQATASATPKRLEPNPLPAANSWRKTAVDLGQEGSPLRPAGPAAVQSQTGETSELPRWQITAGTKMEFDAVAIREDVSGKFKNPNFGLDAESSWVPSGGLFYSDFPLIVDIEFAYKLRDTPYMAESLLANQPKWVSSDIYEIRARADGKPTKDQMRLMVQSVLTDRFKLALHFETRRVPVLALTVIHPGKLGPKLRPHAQGPACGVPLPPPVKGALVKGPDLTPPACSMFMSAPKPNHQWLQGARDVSVPSIAAALSSIAGDAGVDRPIVDQTGLEGNYDFSILFTQETGQVEASGAAATTFLEALKDQLGLKLVRTTAPVLLPVIDHIERPTEN